MLRCFVRQKGIQRNTGGTQKFFVFILEIEIHSADHFRRKGKGLIFINILYLPYRKLEDNFEMQGRAFAAYDRLAIGFGFFPGGIGNIILVQDTALVRIKKVLSDFSIDGKAIKCSDICFHQLKLVKSCSNQELIHKFFKICYFQCQHFLCPSEFSVSIINQNEKKEQSFSEKGFSNRKACVKIDVVFKTTYYGKEDNIIEL